MINCNSCGNKISKHMRHSLKSNECPYCGEYILNNNDLKKCKSISMDLISAGFDDKNIFELSLFIYNKYVKSSNVEVKDSDKLEPVKDLKSDTDEENEELQEVLEFSENESDSAETLDDDDKISRLKKLARNNPILNKKGASVRRISQ